ncbi:hypothetical protein ACFL0D_05650 [Thermoproteota archaeon]
MGVPESFIVSESFGGNQVVFSYVDVTIRLHALLQILDMRVILLLTKSYH